MMGEEEEDPMQGKARGYVQEKYVEGFAHCIPYISTSQNCCKISSGSPARSRAITREASLEDAVTLERRTAEYEDAVTTKR
jgi:hypothetical protein